MVVPAGLTVVTWNAQGSQGLDIDAAAAALAEFTPHLVILQEVQRRQVGALRAAMGARDARWRFKHWPVTVPAEGLGIISMDPLRNVRSHHLAHRWEAWNWRRRIAVRAKIESSTASCEVERPPAVGRAPRTLTVPARSARAIGGSGLGSTAFPRSTLGCHRARGAWTSCPERPSRPMDSNGDTLL